MGRNDPIRSHARHELVHFLEPRERRSIDLEREQRCRRIAARKTGAGARQAAQDLVLGVPESGGIDRGNAKLHEDAGSASSGHGADVGVDHRPIIHAARRAPRGGQGDRYNGDPPRPPHPIFTLRQVSLELARGGGRVVWLRPAMPAFGVITPLVSIVLSVFMAGLALGSWSGGRLARPGTIARTTSTIWCADG